jgi:hypothetical protein
MPLRSFRFYLSGYLHYYEHLRLPRRLWTYAPLGSPTFMRYLGYARNIILLRVSDSVYIAISSTGMAGFTIFGRLTDTNFVSRSLTDAAYITVLSELHKARFLTVCQTNFNLNGKLGCKALSSL